MKAAHASSVLAHAARRRTFARALIVAFACAMPVIAHAQAQSVAAPLPLVECGDSPQPASGAYLSDVLAADRELGVPSDYTIAHDLQLIAPANDLVEAGHDVRGRSVRLAPPAAEALKRMKAAAAKDDVQLQLVSGYRTLAYQERLVSSKLQRGMSVETALSINAVPGFSEHHSGCAVDLTTPGAEPADASFARTRAYAWLQAHAGSFGFHLSYPRDNEYGIEFEPWHWRYVADQEAAARMPPPDKTKSGDAD